MKRLQRAMARHIPIPDLATVLAQVTHREEALEIVFTDQPVVACDGPGGALGHPRTYYNLADKGFVECGYCDCVYVYNPARVGERLEGGMPEIKALLAS